MPNDYTMGPALYLKNRVLMKKYLEALEASMTDGDDNFQLDAGRLDPATIAAVATFELIDEIKARIP